jgi:hypothetical protein
MPTIPIGTIIIAQLLHNNLSGGKNVYIKELVKEDGFTPEDLMAYLNEGIAAGAVLIDLKYIYPPKTNYEKRTNNITAKGE